MTRHDRCGRLVMAATTALLASAAGVLGRPAIAAPFTYEMVTVGDAGNTADTTGYGAVGYEYRIGKYDVTIGQYTAFLNAVAKSDPYGLYDGNMATDLNIAGISRSGSSGSYSYSVINPSGTNPAGASSPDNRPITYVSWFDAARFANWMHNGQGEGSTETGAYTLAGAAAGIAPAVNAGARFFIPTENEWYKAAYYSPAKLGNGLPGYYSYATQSDAGPGNTIGSAANQANYYTGGQLSVSQSTYTPSQNYLTDVGAFTNSASYYGTFDQSGNVYQWNDLDGVAGSSRGLRGGYWLDNGYAGSLAYCLSSSFGYANNPAYELYTIGFRLAAPANSSPVPEIDPAGVGSVLALVGGALGLLERRRSKPAA